MERVQWLVDVVLHLDKHLNSWAADLGPWTYVLLFVIVFCETGLVVTPFLPGDSLLFAVGALCATENASLSLVWCAIVIAAAAIIGDAVNYSIGAWVGPKVFTKGTGWLLNRKHLVRTQAFYEKYGGKTIVIARFVPIVRTFAPFVAGIGKMRYSRFGAYNVAGALLWVILFLPLGFWFGNAPIVKKNFSLVIVGIIVVSCLPVVVEFFRARAEAKRQQKAPHR